MFIKQSKSKTSDKTQLYLVEGYRDGKTIKHRTIKKYGALEDLILKNPDILNELKIEAKRLTLEKEENIISLILDLNQNNEQSTDIKNIGSSFIEKVFESLKLKTLLNDLTVDEKFRYDLYEILSFLVTMRIIKPASKLDNYLNKQFLYREYDLSLDDMYRSLDKLFSYKAAIIKHLDDHMVKHYHRDKTVVYYDVTNYYFESNQTSDLRETGASKENVKHPIVTMGLYIDEHNYPITYDMFKGNTHDSKTFIPSFNKIRDDLNVKKCIVVADKGINGGNNIKHLIDHGHGYIFSSKIRGASQKIIDLTLDEKGYIKLSDQFKYKEAIIKRKVIYENEMGRPKSIEVEEKIVIFYSKNYADKAKHERDKVLESLEIYINNPKLLKGKTKQGRLKYLKQQELNETTGEIVESKLIVSKDMSKIQKDESLDGFYMISTNQIDLSASEIISKYRGLWQIEKSFRIIKSELEGRPIYLEKDERIQGHFLTCFITLLVSRIIEKKLENKYSIDKIQNALQDMNVVEIENGIYKVMKYTQVQIDIQKTLGNLIDKTYIKKEHLNQLLK